MVKCKEIVGLKAVEEGVGTARPHNKSANATGIKSKFGQAEGEFSYCTLSFDRQTIHPRVLVLGETDNTKIQEPSAWNDPFDSCSSSHGFTDLNSEFSDLEVQEEEELSVDTSKFKHGLEICKESLLRDVNYSQSDELGKMTTTTTDTEELEDYYFSVDEKDHHFLRGMNSSRHRSEEAKMPLKDELEEFFSVAENDLMRQFTNKACCRYNFDFVKEQPLEGRYEW